MDYGPLHVLAGLDLWVEHGNVVALLGPNGAGKTTTIEILEGIAFHRRIRAGAGVRPRQPCNSAPSPNRSRVAGVRLPDPSAC